MAKAPSEISKQIKDIKKSSEGSLSASDNLNRNLFINNQKKYEFSEEERKDIKAFLRGYQPEMQNDTSRNDISRNLFNPNYTRSFDYPIKTGPDSPSGDVQIDITGVRTESTAKISDLRKQQHIAEVQTKRFTNKEISVVTKDTLSFNKAHAKANELREYMAEVQTKQSANNEFLASAKKTFENRADTVNELVNLDVPKHAMEKQESWITAHPETPEPNPKTLYGHINTLTRIKIGYEKLLPKLEAMQAQISSEVEKLSLLEIATIDDYLAPIKKAGDIGYKFVRDQFIQQYTSKLPEYYKLAENAQIRDSLLEQATLQLDKIGTAIEKAKIGLEQTTENLDILDIHKKLQLEEYPFFKETDMHSTDEKIPLAPATEFPGRDTENVISALLNEQKSNKTEEHIERIAQALGSYPYGDGINLEKLHTILHKLGDQKGLQFWAIAKNPKYLDSVLSDGAAGAIIETPEFGRHPVTLKRIGTKPETKEREVVVHDNLREKIFTIGVEKFAEQWTGELILSKNALQRYIKEMQTEQSTNDEFLVKARKTFIDRAGEVKELVNLDVPKHAMESWIKVHPATPEPDPTTLYGHINTTAMIKIGYEKHLPKLEAMQAQIGSEVDKLSLLEIPTKNAYFALLLKVGNMSDYSLKMLKLEKTI